jgi:hypothetical protein
LQLAVVSWQGRELKRRERSARTEPWSDGLFSDPKGVWPPVIDFLRRVYPST